MKTITLVGLDNVPEKHKRVFRALTAWDPWHVWVSSKEVSEETVLERAEVLDAARWLGERVFTGAAGDADVSHGIVARRGRWMCLHAIQIIPGLARSPVEDLRGKGEQP